VTWLPFDLHPEYPPEGLPREQLLARYGPGMSDRVRDFFAARGLDPQLVEAELARRAGR